VSHRYCIVQDEGRVRIVTLNRPEVLNALHADANDELAAVWDEFAVRDDLWVGIITGAGERAFSAGNDLKVQAEGRRRPNGPNGFAGITQRFNLDKPLIAAVNGWALGGGCELAMHADVIVAGESAKFGQPEINLGVLPGSGGTQRLPRAVGKAKAMDLCLTARMMDAAEAERAGLVSRVVPNDKLMEEAMAVAEKIAAYSLPAVMMIKESINRAYESTLSEGVLFERRLFHAAFALEDQKEGMAAFVEKRKPKFKNR